MAIDCEPEEEGDDAELEESNSGEDDGLDRRPLAAWTGETIKPYGQESPCAPSS